MGEELELWTYIFKEVVQRDHAIGMNVVDLVLHTSLPNKWQSYLISIFVLINSYYLKKQILNVDGWANNAAKNITIGLVRNVSFPISSIYSCLDANWRKVIDIILRP